MFDEMAMSRTVASLLKVQRRRSVDRGLRGGGDRLVGYRQERVHPKTGSLFIHIKLTVDRHK